MADKKFLFNLDNDLHHRAKVVAVLQGTTITALIHQALDELLKKRKRKSKKH